MTRKPLSGEQMNGIGRALMMLAARRGQATPLTWDNWGTATTPKWDFPVPNFNGIPGIYPPGYNPSMGQPAYWDGGPMGGWGRMPFGNSMGSPTQTPSLAQMMSGVPGPIPAGTAQTLAPMMTSLKQTAATNPIYVTQNDATSNALDLAFAGPEFEAINQANPHLMPALSSAMAAQAAQANPKQVYR